MRQLLQGPNGVEMFPSARILEFGRSLRHAACSRSAATLRAAWELVYPSVCLFCDKDFSESTDQSQLCSPCALQLALPPGPLCPRCAQAIPAGIEPAPNCAQCAGRKLYFDSARAMGRYEGSLRTAILRMKHAADEPLALAIAQLMVSRFGHSLTGRFDAVIPVPMHWSRRLVRRTNSPEIVAARLARSIRSKFEPAMLVRSHRTEPQGHLPRSRRLRNVRGAMRVSTAFDVKDAHLLVVDDVMTTGATANECARALKKAGAGLVDVVVVARADTPQ